MQRPTMTIHYGALYSVENNNLTDIDVATIRTKLNYALPGWEYDILTGEFAGPARDDAYTCITAILTEWSDNRPTEPPAPPLLGIDMSRGRPNIDPTMHRTKCKKHGANVAQSYIGRERYACWHCANEEYDRLTA